LKNVSPQEEAVRDFLLPAQAQGTPECMSIRAFSKRVVATAALGAKAHCPRQRFEKRGFSRAVLPHQERDRRGELASEITREQGNREGINIRLPPILAKIDAGEERASQPQAGRR